MERIICVAFFLAVVRVGGHCYHDNDHCADVGTNILVLYASDEQNQIKMLAEAIGMGITSVGANAKVMEVSSANYKRDVFEWAHGVVLGSGTFNGNPAPRLLNFVNSFDFEDDLKTKVGSAFATGGAVAAGMENVLGSLEQSLRTFGMVTVGGTRWQNAHGTAGVVSWGSTSTDGPWRETVALAKDQGQRVAHLAYTLKMSSSTPGNVVAPLPRITQLLGSLTASLTKTKYTKETKLNATCESYCRGWMAAPGCGTCLPGAFSFPGADSMCVHPGPTGTGLLCRVDQVDGHITGESCCGVGGPCELPAPAPIDPDDKSLWPGSCCLPAGAVRGSCDTCPGGSPISEIFPLLNDTRTHPDNRRWFDYSAMSCKVGSPPSNDYMVV